MNVEELILGAAKRPQMYIRNLILNEFLVYIDGVLFTKRVHNLLEHEDMRFSQEFPKWICRNLGVPESYSERWEHAIYMTSADEQSALMLFFEKYKEFLEGDGTSI